MAAVYRRNLEHASGLADHNGKPCPASRLVELCFIGGLITTPLAEPGSAHQSGVDSSRDQTIRDNPKKDVARGHNLAGVIPARDLAELPASPSTVEFLNETVPRPRPRAGLDWTAPIVPPQPNGPQMSLPPKGRFPEACLHHPLGAFKAAPADTTPIGRVQRDRFVV